MKVKLNNPENGRGLRVRASRCLLLWSPVVVLIPCVCLCGRVCLGKIRSSSPPWSTLTKSLSHFKRTTR